MKQHPSVPVDRKVIHAQFVHMTEHMHRLSEWHLQGSQRKRRNELIRDPNLS